MRRGRRPRTSGLSDDRSYLEPLTIGNAADTMDWRYYWSALDQMLAGDATPTFDMGSWTSGTAVKTPVVLAN